MSDVTWQEKTLVWLFRIGAALTMTGGNVRLIAGGILEEKDVSSVEEILLKCVLSAYVIGEAGPALGQAWSRVMPCQIHDTLEDAVLAAARDARPGETVLLSPGCASFDQFVSYAERGDKFADIVKGLKEEQVS